MSFLSSVKADLKPMGIESHKYLNDKLKYKNAFFESMEKINDVENIFLINDVYHYILRYSDDNDLKVYMSELNKIQNFTNDGIWNALRLTDVILDRLKESSIIYADTMIEIERLIENLDYAMKISDEDSEDNVNEFRNVAFKYKTLKGNIMMCPCRPSFLPKAYIQESAMNPDGDTIHQIYNNTTNPNDIIDELYSIDHEELFINKMNKIYDYYSLTKDILNVNSNIEPECTVSEFNTIVLITHVYNNVMYNITGLISLCQTIEKILDIIPSDRIKFIKYLNDFIDHIKSVVEDDNKSLMLHDSPLHSMGIGVLYDIIPEKVGDSNEIKISDLNSCINENYDVMCTLSESIFSTRRSVSKQKLSKELRDEHRRRVAELQDRRMADEYDMELSKNRTDVDIQNTDKSSKASLKREIKRRTKEAKLEEKLKDKEAKAATKRNIREAKRANAASAGNVTIFDKYNTAKYTNGTVFMLNRALKRIVGAAVAGGVGAMAGFNPAFLAVSKALIDKCKQDGPRERRAAFNGVVQQLEYVRNKKELARASGDNKAYLQLQKMENKLNAMQSKLAYALPDSHKVR